MIRKASSLMVACSLLASTMYGADDILDYVNPFIGTSNFGTTNPGAVCPNGLMSVVPFNVTGSDDNKFDKDARWWSTPYEFYNSYFTGFSHVNLSGVGCPDLGSLLLMPTTGKLEVDYTKYGSGYKNEKASPGYYTNHLTKYDITTEVTATPRTGRSRFTFPAGKSNILMNLGQGLTNESGASVRFVSDTEIEGMRFMGTFCYSSQSVFPIYFVMRLSKAPAKAGFWKKQRTMTGAEADWDPHHGRYKIYETYQRDFAGDDIGAYFTFDTQEDEAIEVEVGVSFVSIENARENLDREQNQVSFDAIRAQAEEDWREDLSRILVEGGTEEQRTVFYSALYHALIHPNILSDVNGQYPMMESNKIGQTKDTRYTVFSLWDTYRNVHQLLTMVYPERQLAMINTMLSMYKEHGWLPKWELFGRETLTMEGDPSLPVIVDTWKKGLQDFDINLAYEAMYKSATAPGAENLMRPDMDDYVSLGYVPLRGQYDNSVSHALEYYVADHALSTLAEELGKKEDAKLFYDRAMGYKNYFCKDFGTMRPKLPDGTFYKDFDPEQGKNFEPCPGFHEGTSWNYTFYVPHDVKGLTRVMGGKKGFISKLQHVFDEDLYDPANEPDIAYPYLFSYYPDEAWRTQKLVKELLAQHFSNQPKGLPGNDDTGTMSTWAIFSMIGLYPDCPGVPEYTLTTPTFDRVRIKLSPKYYKHDELVIEKKAKNASQSSGDYIHKIYLDGKSKRDYRISHEDLFDAEKLVFEVQDVPSK